MKIGIIVAGVMVGLLGMVAAVTLRSDGSAPRTDTVASDTAQVVTTVVTTVPASQPAPASAGPSTPTTASKAPATTVAPAKAPATATTPPSVPRTPQEIQQFVAGLTAQLQTSATSGVAPLTKEQVEAQVRAQLKLLGITL